MLTEARAIQATIAALKSDATLTALLGAGANGIFLQDVPAGALDPYAVVAQQATLRDIQARGGQLVMGKGLITVQVIGKATDLSAKLVPAADRIDALLNTLAGVSVNGGTVVRIVRDRELFYTEPLGDTGVVYAHAGYIYQWWAQ